MEERDITRSEQKCISECIMTNWSNMNQEIPERDKRYEQCLSDCNVCG